MRALIFGGSGQVGWELARSLAPLCQELATDRRPDGRRAVDVTAAEAVTCAIRACRPDVIVNAAAYTAVDRAESEPDAARAVNAQAPAVMAAEAQRSGALLVHFSTDYVFDGSGSTPWREQDATVPLNVYGRTKLEGEQSVRESGCRYLILRTSWVHAARGENFILKILRRARSQPSLEVVCDQFGAPTSAELLADATAHALLAVERDPALAGTYHIACSGETTWFDCARLVLEVATECGQELQASPESIRAVPSSAFAVAARRPGNSRLNTERFRSHFAVCLPDWSIGVRRTLVDLQGG